MGGIDIVLGALYHSTVRKTDTESMTVDQREKENFCGCFSFFGGVGERYRVA